LALPKTIAALVAILVLLRSGAILSAIRPPAGNQTILRRRLMEETATKTCLECDGVMSPIVIMDKTYP
jgi:hypothetical protein